MSHLLFPVINFILFCGVLFYFLKKPLRQFFKTRSVEIEKSIQEATQAYDQAQVKHEEAKQKLNRIEAEKKEMIEQTEKDIEQLHQKSEEFLKKLVEKMQQEHEQRLTEELQKAVENLKSKIAKRIVEATEDVLQTKLKTKDQERLIENILEKEKSWHKKPPSATLERL